MKFKCDNGHIIDINVSNLKRFLKLCQQGKRVCPTCKPANIRISIYDDNDNSNKKFQCRHGHETLAYAFNNGICGIQWGSGFGDRENFECSPKELEKFIYDKKIKCKFLKENGKNCNCILKPIDDHDLDLPHVGWGFKTKTRVEDVWRRNKVIEPKANNLNDYVETGQINETEFTQRNRARLKKLRKERLSEKQGEIMNRPTRKVYTQGKPRRPSGDEL